MLDIARDNLARLEQADVWLGFTPEQIEGFFGSARLARHGYATLGSR
jgi:hypothetical protein